MLTNGMRIFAAAVLASAVATAACNPTIDFQVPIEGQATIEGGGLVPGLLGAVGLGDLATLDLSNTQEFENNDVRKEQVVSTRLQRLTLTILSGDPDFNFLDSLSFAVAAPELEKQRVASKVVPNDVATFDLDRDDIDIAAYVRADNIALSSEVEGSQPSADTTIQIELVFDVKAEVLGS